MNADENHFSHPPVCELFTVGGARSGLPGVPKEKTAHFNSYGCTTSS